MAVGSKKPVVMGEQLGQPGGVATLGTDGKLAESQRPTADGVKLSDGTTIAAALAAETAARKKAVSDEAAERTKELAKKTSVVIPSAVGNLAALAADGQLSDSGTRVCNPNLLDNWYFPNPVNQRGQTEYTPNWNQYTIDRWSIEGTTGDIKVVVSTGCVDVKNMLQQSADHSIQFKQVLPTEICLPGKTYTLSVLTKNVVGSVSCYLAQSGAPYHTSFEWPITSGLSTYTGVMLDGQQRVGFTFSAGASISLIAIKLELGPSQTLAHQENGVWVPNEIPDYGEQLRRCQRYFFRIAPINQVYIGLAYCYTTSNARTSIRLPASLRALPTISNDNAVLAAGIVSTGLESFFQVTLQIVGGDIMSGNIICDVISTTHTLVPGTFLQLYVNQGAYVDFSADL